MRCTICQLEFLRSLNFHAFLCCCLLLFLHALLSTEANNNLLSTIFVCVLCGMNWMTLICWLLLLPEIPKQCEVEAEEANKSELNLLSNVEKLILSCRVVLSVRSIEWRRHRAASATEHYMAVFSANSIGTVFTSIKCIMHGQWPATAMGIFQRRKFTKALVGLWKKILSFDCSRVPLSSLTLLRAVS